MKILFLTPQVPYPPQKGTALRNWGLISGLAARHEVAVLSFSSPPFPPPPAGGDRGGGSDPLTSTCHIEIVDPPARVTRDRLRDMLTTRQPDMALRLASEAYARRLAAWLARESFDVVHVEGIELAPYLDIVEAAQPRPLIVFTHPRPLARRGLLARAVAAAASLRGAGLPPRRPRAGGL